MIGEGQSMDVSSTDQLKKLMTGMERYREAIGQFGLLGPCSFEDCVEFAEFKCQWKMNWGLSSGGCEELYCRDHAFTPPGAKDPVCCINCANAYTQSKKRQKCVFGIVVTIIVLIIVVIIMGIASELNKENETGGRRQRVEDAWDRLKDVVEEVVEEKVNRWDDTWMDERVYSEAVGTDMWVDVNKFRVEGGKNSLEWQELWSNLVYDVATDFSRGTLVSSAEYKAQKFLEMDALVGKQHLDHQIDVVFVDLKSPTTMVDALAIINGGSRTTQTHLSIGAYTQEGSIAFAQASARAIEDPFDTDENKSLAWGKKGQDLINQHRED